MGRPGTRRQVSAGGIVYRVREGTPEVVLVLVLRKDERRWVLPKGLVAEGESLEETARREVREETGIEAAVEGDLPPVDSWYCWPPGQRWNRVHKTVHYFLMRFESGDTALHDQEVEDARWFPLAEAIAAVAYASDRQLLQEVQTRLQA